MVGVGLIGAEVTGADRGGKMTPQRGMLVANFLHHRADVLADQPARAFRADSMLCAHVRQVLMIR